jgi:polysaccharide deacetylase 2 family uncharacterized protein YibQ
MEEGVVAKPPPTPPAQAATPAPADIPAEMQADTGAPRPGGLNALAGPTTTGTAPPQQAAPGGVGIVVSSVTANSFSAAPELPATPLTQQPDPALQEQGSEGQLPKIDGSRMAWQVYARPFNKDEKRPRVAVIVGGLGLSAVATEAAIKRLPAGVTLAFDPYAVGSDQWAAKARAAGHEVMLMIHTESETFPAVDPGPQALMTTIEPSDNLRRLNFALTRFSGYTGIITTTGSRFTAVEGQLRPLLEVLKRRGLMFVDGGGSKQSLAPKVADEIGVPDAQGNFILDENPAKSAIDETLTKLELLARQNSAAVATASAYPSTIERLATWSKTLDSKNLVLAPVSAVADRQAKAAPK